MNRYPKNLCAWLCLVSLLTVSITGIGCAAQIEAPEGDVNVAAQALNAPSERTIPAALAVPEGNHFLAALGATGQQIYECRATATGFGWVFVAPEADLFKDNQYLVGSHFVGPTWELLDGSNVVGARVAGETVDATAIPWLLLRVVSHVGYGPFSKSTYIQRLDTVGGLAPTTVCDADHVGDDQGVDYTANYYFYWAD